MVFQYVTLFHSIILLNPYPFRRSVSVPEEADYDSDSVCSDSPEIQEDRILAALGAQSVTTEANSRFCIIS